MNNTMLLKDQHPICEQTAAFVGSLSRTLNGYDM